MNNSESIREQRLRRMAERQGYRLNRSKRRDPRAYDHGKYFVTDIFTNVLQTDERGMTLDQVEDWLDQA